MTESTAPTTIEAAGLTKHYGPFIAAEDVTFSVPAGQVAAFLGPNGAGKSTTMRMIYRACPVGSGALRILGLDATSGRHDRAIKRRLGVVPQEYVPQLGPCPAKPVHESQR